MKGESGLGRNSRSSWKKKKVGVPGDGKFSVQVEKRGEEREGLA